MSLTERLRQIDLNDHHRDATDLDLLEKVGDEGWELVVSTINSMAYLKREFRKPRSRRKP